MQFNMSKRTIPLTGVAVMTRLLATQVFQTYFLNKRFRRFLFPVHVTVHRNKFLFNP